MARFYKSIIRKLRGKTIKPVTPNSNWFDVRHSMYNAIQDLNCVDYVELRHTGEDILIRTKEAIEWCEDNCKDQYFYTIGMFHVLMFDGDVFDHIITSDNESQHQCCFFAFRSREDCFAFYLFFN